MLNLRLFFYTKNWIQWELYSGPRKSLKYGRCKTCIVIQIKIKTDSVDGNSFKFCAVIHINSTAQDFFYTRWFILFPKWFNPQPCGRGVCISAMYAGSLPYLIFSNTPTASPACMAVFFLWKKTPSECNFQSAKCNKWIINNSTIELWTLNFELSKMRKHF